LDGRGRRTKGLLTDFWHWASKQKGARIEGKEKNKRKRVFYFEKHQTNEFKYKFEFKHSKAMHQHVCNIKLL
jgi:hypothetical protein